MLFPVDCVECGVVVYVFCVSVLLVMVLLVVCVSWWRSVRCSCCSRVVYSVLLMMMTLFLVFVYCRSVRVVVGHECGVVRVVFCVVVLVGVLLLCVIVDDGPVVAFAVCASLLFVSLWAAVVLLFLLCVCCMCC